MFFKTSQIKNWLCLNLPAYTKENKVKNIFNMSYFFVYVWGKIKKVGVGVADHSLKIWWVMFLKQSFCYPVINLKKFSIEPMWSLMTL